MVVRALRVMAAVAIAALAAVVAVAACSSDSFTAADAGADAGAGASADAVAGADEAGSDARACTGPHLHFDPASGHCYVYGDALLAWNAAESDCVSTYGGHLVSISSAPEQAFVRDLIATERATKGTTLPEAGVLAGVWIGLHRPDAGAPYVWADGEPESFTNWSAGASKVNACVAEYNGFNQEWDDFQCTVRVNYVCEGR